MTRILDYMDTMGPSEFFGWACALILASAVFGYFRGMR